MMKRNLTVLLAAGASGLFAMTAAQAQGPAQALEGAYRGMIVCEKIPIAADILHVPFDLIVHGTNAEFARPVFGLKGGRVIGSELGSGTVDADGKIHVTATRVFLGQTVQSEYSGTLHRGRRYAERQAIVDRLHGRGRPHVPRCVGDCAQGGTRGGPPVAIGVTMGCLRGPFEQARLVID
jgi:hypothetical protein